jgi:hypothetical protein
LFLFDISNLWWAACRPPAQVPRFNGADARSSLRRSMTRDESAKRVG